MKFLFLDESDKQAKGTRIFFLVSGLFVDGSNLFDLNNELEGYKVALGMNNLKDLRKNRSLKHREKLTKTSELYTILLRHKVKILTAILGRTTMSSSSKFEEAYMGALSFLVERFCLQIRPDKGMIFFDNMEGSIQRYVEDKFYSMVQHEPLIMHGEKLHDYKDLIYPAISFIKDNFSAILQVSDLIANSINDAVFKSITDYDFISISRLPSLSPYLNIYWPLIVKSPEGKISGWGIKLWN